MFMEGGSKNQKQPKCPSTGEWINNSHYSSTMAYYSAVTRNALVIYTTSMILRIITLGEGSQIKTSTAFMIQFPYNVLENANSYIVTKCRLIIFPGMGQGERT